MHKVHMHAGAIRQYGCVFVREIIHSLKLVDYLPYIIHTHKPYNNIHIRTEIQALVLEALT